MRPVKAVDVMVGSTRHAVSLYVLILLTACSNNPPGAKASPKPLSSPQAFVPRDYGPPQASTPLLYMHDPNNGAWLVGLDWQGNPPTTVKPKETEAQQAPDGSLFQVHPGVSAGVWTGKFLDRFGQPLKAVALPKGIMAGFDMWADDSRHVCFMSYDPTDSSWRVVVSGPEAPTQVLAVMTVDAQRYRYLSVAACSPGSDRAVVVRTAFEFASHNVVAWVTDTWAVRLSDGTIVAHRSYETHTTANVVASADAKYIAENSLNAGEVGTQRGTVLSIVRRVSDWSYLKTLGAPVEAFSGDGSLVFVAPAVDTTQGGLNHGATVMDWRSGATLWHETGADYFGRPTAQPGGRDFAVARRAGLSLPSDSCVGWTCGSPRRIEIISGDGSAITLPDLYIPAW